MDPKEAMMYGFNDEMSKLGFNPFNPAVMKGIKSFMKGWKGVGKAFMRGGKTKAGGFGRAVNAFGKQMKYNKGFRYGTLGAGALGAYTLGKDRDRYRRF